MFSLFALLALFAVTTAFAQNPGYVKGDIGTHDPSMCRDASGTYFLFATAPGISVVTSTDRITFKYQGVVWPNGGATWTNEYTGTSNGNLWAPECYHDGKQFWLYYSASSFGKNKSAIFLATSPTGYPGTWTHKGLVHSTSASNDYNAIDPNLFIEGGKWYLSLGSFWSGIKLIELNPSTGLALNTGVTSIAYRPTNNGAVEASTIYKSGSYYYLFTSFDSCCAGTSSTYSIRVARSTSVFGPYTDQYGVSSRNGGGTLILGTHGAITGPGGQDIIVDVDGVFLVYHYYNSAGSFLGINRLDFSSGWPVVS